MIDRMLQDGLIAAFEHGELYLATRLFIRLHNIFQLGMISRMKDEYVDILLTLYEMKKIDRSTFLYMVVIN